MDTKARNNDREEFRSSEFIAFQADKEKPALKNDYPGRRPEGDMLISVESPALNIRNRGEEPTDAAFNVCTEEILKHADIH